MARSSSQGGEALRAVQALGFRDSADKHGSVLMTLVRCPANELFGVA